MTKDQVLALVSAHYAGDNEMFSKVVLQIACEFKGAAARAEFQRQAGRPSPTAMQLLPEKTKDVVEPVTLCKMSDLVLSDDLASELREFVAERRGQGKLLTRGMFPRSRMLFTGPPGCGKTSAAGAVAAELGLSAFRVHFPGLLGNGFMGTAANSVRNALGPVMRTGHLVVFDEIDAIGTARTDGSAGGADREYNVLVSTLLTELDSVGSNGVFIATTNRPELLDPALRRRFEDELEFQAPSDGAKELLATKLWAAFDLPPALRPRSNGEASFDAVAKMVSKAARRLVLADVGGAA